MVLHFSALFFLCNTLSFIHDHYYDTKTEASIPHVSLLWENKKKTTRVPLSKERMTTSGSILKLFRFEMHLIQKWTCVWIEYKKQYMTHTPTRFVSFSLLKGKTDCIYCPGEKKKGIPARVRMKFETWSLRKNLRRVQMSRIKIEETGLILCQLLVPLSPES